VVEPVDEKENKHRVRLGTATSNAMSKEQADEAATAIAHAMGELLPSTP
jgi:hypothetical protein